MELRDDEKMQQEHTKRDCNPAVAEHVPGVNRFRQSEGEKTSAATDGTAMRPGTILREGRTAEGRVFIESVVGPPPSRGGENRKGYEQQFFPGVKVDLKAWERSHSQGAGTGAESARGIRYAPREVNQELQNRGIEQCVRDLYLDAKKRGVALYQITETETHPGTLRLASIVYRIGEFDDKGKKARTLFEAEIEIENKREKPKVAISASYGGRWACS